MCQCLLYRRNVKRLQAYEESPESANMRGMHASLEPRPDTRVHCLQTLAQPQTAPPPCRATLHLSPGATAACRGCRPLVPWRRASLASNLPWYVITSKRAL